MVLRRMAVWSVVLSAVLSTAAQAGDPVRTIFLPRGPGGGSAPMSVAYHPDYDYYYASNGGNPGYGAWVFDGAGNRLQDTTVNIDVRAWNFNSNTDQLEILSYNAKGGDGVNYGLFAPGVDNNGLLTGAKTTLLNALPGLIDSQTMPAYDSVNDEFYSRSTGAAVNVAKRSDGSLVRSFSLSGAPGLTSYSCGFDADAQLVIVVTNVGNRALAYDVNGNFVDEWNLDIVVPVNYSMGYTNGQLFVFDAGRNGWQGYDLGLSGAKCNYRITRSKAKGGCQTCPDRGDSMETEEACENVEDCSKKLKTTISCPEGDGACKIKGKRASCG